MKILLFCWSETGKEIKIRIFLYVVSQKSDKISNATKPVISFTLLNLPLGYAFIVNHKNIIVFNSMPGLFSS